ncbi:coiled-coil domain-containing protein 18-like isoform X1 [Juglans microcarpa x Juglans regia]|uniref:coiled-coil domain-containing protein 18-like isoform X1 n=2 Tax=Juglans microcarpa x Juglans regia TaxID=2249226 RepID=UPI001B7E6FDE|nr:coiled-coil domain-containing protein 18-like isoform X1 [Juglans microcarpa x Juglans regia]
MFRLHNKNKHAKSGNRVDFNFSRFKALQVPKGWDKLLVSIISVETGKTLSKSGKALVHNGSCQWAETLSGSLRISQDDPSKELEDCFFKLVVSTASSRSGILGEAIVNMIAYMSSPAPAPVSLPLNKCNYGTILQVKIHCLTPITKLRDEESKETNFRMEHQEANYNDVDSKSDVSGSTFTRSIGSSSSKDLGSISHPGEPGSRETSFSASGSHHSNDSREGSTGREKFSPRSSLSSDGHGLIGREAAIGSQDIVHSGFNPIGNPIQSDHSSSNLRLTASGNDSQNSWQEFATSSLKPAISSKNLMEAAHDTIEELRAEAKMWERDARKLMLDLDILRKEFTEQSKNQENLTMELSAAYADRDGLKKAVEQMKISLERPMVQQAETEHSTFQDEDISHIQKELKDELKFQKESNADLALQLQRSQASNLELVSVLQELEETIEKQKIEINTLSAPPSKLGDIENFVQVTVEENRNLMLQLQQLQESEKSLQVKVQQLEQALEKNHPEGSLNNHTILEIEANFKGRLDAKDEEILMLRAKLSESLKGRNFPDRGSINEGDANLIREIEILKEKMQELERDCDELTDENLELLFKLKEAKKNSMMGGTIVDLPTNELLNKSFISFEPEMTEHKSQMYCVEDKLQIKNLVESEDKDFLSTQELETLNIELQNQVTEQGKKLTDKISDIAKLETKLQYKEEEIGVLKQCQIDLEAKISHLQKENIQLEKQMKVMHRESDITSKCLNDLRSDLIELSNSLDSHVSANKILERKSSELENGKHELELCIVELKQENMQLSLCISGLEDQLRHLTDERESKSHAQSLQDEISRLRIEISSEKADMKEKLQDTQNRWSEAQEECDYLIRENSKLKATTVNLIEECSTLQKSNGELRKQKSELHESFALLEAKLRESEIKFENCSKRVGILEDNISSMLVDISSKEKSLTSELDALVVENRRNVEKLAVGERLFNQMYLEKNVELENLQQHVEHLTDQLSAIHEAKERIATDAVLEVSNLLADKVSLESALQESQTKMKWIENELEMTRTESESKLQSLIDELAASKQNQEKLMADHERVFKLLENYKSDEEKFKNTVNGLELKLTFSEFEREQLLEESKKMKVELQNMAHLHDDVLAVKNDLHTTKFEKERLEASLHLISGECEDLKTEKNLLVEKISALEDCKRKRVALEDKAQCAQEAELKTELGQIKKANRQYQQKIRLLEEEKDQCVTKAQALEEELKLMKEGKQNQRESSSPKIPSFSKTNSKVTPVREDMKPSKKNEMVKNSSQHRDSKRRQPLKNGKVQELLKDQQKLSGNQYQREDDSGNEIPDGSPPAVGVDPASKLQLLENELAKALEANNIYKAQIDRLLTEGQSSHTDVSRKSTAEDEIVAKERNGRTKSSLEAELIDIRERYLHMSLKYAEVEAQREELVMKLKTVKNVKRTWLS